MFNKHNIIIPWEMLNQDKKDEDEKVDKQAKNNPNVDEFNLWCFGQLWSNRVVESVHDEHGGDGHGDAGLEMFFSEENCCLRENCIKISSTLTYYIQGGIFNLTTFLENF